MTFSFIERRACPACDCIDRIKLVDTPLDGPVIGPVVGRYYRIDPARLAGGRYIAVRCARCATIYQAQVGGDDLLTTLYDVWLNELPDAGDQTRLDWLSIHPRLSRDGHELMTVAAMLGIPIRGMKTFDFGMGKGLWAGIAHKLGCESYGFDLSATRMRLARSKGIRTVSFDQIAGSCFDVINAEQVMEHVTDVRMAMKTLAAGLRRGGVLKISVPAQGSIEEKLKRIRAGEIVASSDIIPILPLEHVNAFSICGLEILGSDFGLMKMRPTLFHRLRFIASPGNWLSVRPANTMKELIRPFIPYENDRNLTIWLMAGAGL